MPAIRRQSMSVNITAANREAVDRLCRARPAWTAVRPAREALGLTGQQLLHAGPPIAWERMCGPMRGAVTAAVLFEGWARTPEDARARWPAPARSPSAPCHSRGAVGPMAGVISPGTPLLVVEDAVNGTAACSFIADGPWGHQLRFGAHGPETLARPRVDPRRRRARLPGACSSARAPIDLASLMAQALAMGDEMHMRNAAATGLLARRLAAPLVGVGRRSAADLEAVLRFVTRDNDQFFLAWSMCAAKAAARSIEGLEGSTIVSHDGAQRRRVRHPRGRARRPVVHRARRASSRASTSPASARRTPTSTPATPRSWRRRASAAWRWPPRPPCRRSWARSRSRDAVATTREMAEICAGANPLFPIAPLDGEGTPTGIDIRQVARTGHRAEDQHRDRARERAAHDRRRHRDAAARAVRRRPGRVRRAVPGADPPRRDGRLATDRPRAAVRALVLPGLDGADARGRRSCASCPACARPPRSWARRPTTSCSPRPGLADAREHGGGARRSDPRRRRRRPTRRRTPRSPPPQRLFDERQRAREATGRRLPRTLDSALRAAARREPRDDLGARRATRSSRR